MQRAAYLLQSLKGIAQRCSFLGHMLQFNFRQPSHNTACDHWGDEMMNLYKAPTILAKKWHSCLSNEASGLLPGNAKSRKPSCCSISPVDNAQQLLASLLPLFIENQRGLFINVKQVKPFVSVFHLECKLWEDRDLVIFVLTYAWCLD